MKFPNNVLLILGTASICLLTLVGCSKQTNDIPQTGEAMVSVTLAGVALDEAENGSAEALRINRSATHAGSLSETDSTIAADGPQTFSMPFDDEIMIFGSLEQSGSAHAVDASEGTPHKAKRGSKAVIERNPLPANTQYRLIVYDSNNVYVTDRLYTHTQEASAEDLVLDGGKTYTFVGVSINSTSSAPTVSYTNNNNRTLATSSVNNVTGDLMYFKETLTLNGGTNNLNVVLRHVFSQITTNLLIDPAIGGTITALSTPVLRPQRVNGSMNLGTEAITYGNEVTAGQAISFPGIGSGGTKTLSSTPTLLRSPSVTNGALAIESLTVNGITRTGLSFPNLRVNPGKRYNLNLSFRVPCTEEVNSSTISIRDGRETTFSAPAADYGFTMDIFTLDNSFNMVINGVRLSNQEVQFQSNAPTPRNMRFQDGALWGNGTVPQIWDLNGTAAAPIIRIVISENGTISMLGSKTSGGRLFPLVPTGSMVFNNITWNKTGSNTVRITQEVQGTTYLTGRGRGTRIVPCRN